LTYITASEMNETTSPDLRILVAGDIPMADFGPWRAARAGHDLAAEVLRARPDLLVMDAALATAELAAQLEADWLKDLRLVLVTGAEDADAAGLLIERPIELLDKPVSRERLRDAVDRSFARHVADAGGAYIDDRLAALRRDAERVAAALQELTGSNAAEPARPVTAARIRAHIKARRLRERFFDPALFADPVWDILLDLAASKLEERPVSVSSLCIAASVPTTTALRSIKAMVERGLLKRNSDPADARRTFIGMTAQTDITMAGCLEVVLNTPGL